MLPRTATGPHPRRAMPTLVSVLSLLVAVATVLVQLGAPAAAQDSSTAPPSKAQWVRDTHHAMYGSRAYIEDRIAQARKSGEKHLAINLDIDNTSLATYYAAGKPVGVTLRLARFARKHGVVLVFNTGRLVGEGRMHQARKQLAEAGYVVTKICGRSGPREHLAASKQRCRQRFADQGLTLVENVGNRSTDFAGGGYERAFRLPNYGNTLG